MKKTLLVLGLLVLVAALAACAGPAGPAGPTGPVGPVGPAGPAGPAGQSIDMNSLTCAECHNDTALITRHKANWTTSIHGTGAGLASAGERNTCAGCHDGATFSEMIAAGQNFTQIESGNAAPTHQDCRTCHQIHVTFTGEDWALETTAPVALVASGQTFEGGTGNLCAHCHQARRYLAGFAAKDAAGTVIPGQYTATARFNTHYSVQVDVLMGSLDFSIAEGKPSGHYTMVENTCVACHMGEQDVHTFEAQLGSCVACHADAENFDVNGFVTDFDAKYAELEAALLAKGMIVEQDGAYVTVPGTYETGPAEALFFYNLVYQDGSQGIHNPTYFTALLDAALEALK